MARCVRTGAVVYFSEYGCTVRADVFEVGDTVVIQLGGAFHKSATYDRKTALRATHQVEVGHGYFQKERGVVVVPREALKELQA